VVGQIRRRSVQAKNPRREAGKQNMGIKWFETDNTDYTTWTLADVNRSFSREQQ